MDNIVRQIIESKGSKSVLVYELGTNNEKFELTRRLKSAYKNVIAVSEEELAEHIINSFMRDKSTPEIMPDAELLIFYDIDFFTCKNIHIAELKRIIDTLKHRNVLCLFTCHSAVPEDINKLFYSCGAKKINTKATTE